MRPGWGALYSPALADRIVAYPRAHRVDGALDRLDPAFAGVEQIRLHRGARRFRLIGAGLVDLEAAGATVEADLFDTGERRIEAVERAIDAVRAKFGDDAIRKGRGLKRAPARPHPPK